MQTGAPSGRDAETVLADYYDSDHPSVTEGPADNWDDASVALELATDVSFYAGLRPGARVLELGAGTGRITDGLLAVGCEVHAVEPDPAMRERLQGRALRLAGTKCWIHASMDGIPRGLDLAVLGFGVLACVSSRASQVSLLRQVRSLLREGGLLALDDPSQETLPPAGRAAPTPTWVRTHVERGTRYARFASSSAPDETGTVSIKGSYQELERAESPFALSLRVSTREDKERMLEEAGFQDIVLANAPDAPALSGPRTFALATVGAGDGKNADRWWSGDPSGAARTALSSAAARALDARGASLIGDRHAVCLQGRSGRRLLAESGGVEMMASILARASWFDDRIRAASRSLGGLLHLGAGLCTRSLRMPELAGAPITEIDQPELLRFKRERLARFPRPSVREVGRDVDDIAAVLSEFERLPRPRWVIAEGLLPYLQPAQAEALVASLVQRLGPGERMLFDTATPNLPANTVVTRRLEAHGIRFGTWSPEPLLSRRPGIVYRVTHLGASDARAGLPPGERGGSLLWWVEPA